MTVKKKTAKKKTSSKKAGKQSEKKSSGRPPLEFKEEEYCNLLIEHMRQGLSFESFASLIPCCKDTLYQWLKKYPRFSDAKKTGTELSRVWWEREGIQGMWGGKAFHPAMWIFNMRNRFGWTDKQKEEEEDKGKAITVKLSYDPNE